MRSRATLRPTDGECNDRQRCRAGPGICYAASMPPPGRNTNAPDFTLRSRRVVLGGEVLPASIVVRGGHIAAVNTETTSAADTTAHASSLAPAPAGGRLIDVGELVVMPGIIDAHVHVNEPGRTDWEGFATAGRAAAAGGVTTMVVMPLNCSPVATTPAALHAEADAAARTCIVDHGFWGGLIPGNAHQLRPLWDAGVLGFKCFLVHSGLDEFPNVTRADLGAAMPLLAGLAPGGAVLLAHAEDPTEVAAARGPSGLDQSPRSYAAYLASRPESAERAAIEMMIELCRAHRSRVHIVHVSAASALPMLAAAQGEGLPLSSETCPHYLAFAADQIADGQTVFKCAPPIRNSANRESLWAGLRDETLDLIGSDHSPCPPELKGLDTGNFATSWGGVSSLQLTLPAVWTHARVRGFTLTDLARWLCAAPARLAGIHAFKGRIAPGFDADLLVFDPDASWDVQAAALQHRHKITPYDGVSLRGVVTATFLRGRQVYNDTAGGRGFEPLNPLGQDGFATEATGQWVKRTRT